MRIPMNRRHRTIQLAFATAALQALATAQSPESFLFSVMSPETTLSGSSGTSLQTVNPNEIAHLVTTPPCALVSAEVWAPRTAFHAMAGDENGNDVYWRTNLFGRIDAILPHPCAVTETNVRNTFFSPAAPMGNVVSAPDVLRPGDVARLAPDGQVEYFMTAEQFQMALGLPPTPVVVNVDAVAFSRQFGVFFSLEDDQPVSLCGASLVRDGDIVLIPTSAIAMTSSCTIASVAPNSAAVVYRENQVNAMVAAAQVTDRNGACLSAIGDVDALEIDLMGPVVGRLWCGTTWAVPTLVFAGETMTGASVLDTAFGGRIRPGACGDLGTGCGSGPTFGTQMGLQATSSTQGCASSINGLGMRRTCRFVTASPSPTNLAPAPLQIEVAGPPGTFVWIFGALASSGPGAITPSSPFFPGNVCYPDVHLPLPTYIDTVFTDALGFGSLATAPMLLPFDVHVQAIYIDSTGAMQLSTPSTIELF